MSAAVQQRNDFEERLDRRRTGPLLDRTIALMEKPQAHWGDELTTRVGVVLPQIRRLRTDIKEAGLDRRTCGGLRRNVPCAIGFYVFCAAVEGEKVGLKV